MIMNILPHYLITFLEGIFILSGRKISYLKDGRYSLNYAIYCASRLLLIKRKITIKKGIIPPARWTSHDITPLSLLIFLTFSHNLQLAFKRYAIDSSYV